MIQKTNFSDKSISKYIDCLEDAFLITRAKRYDIRGRKYIENLSKFYFSDLGIRNVAINFRQQEETHIMENVIYNELRLRGFDVDVGNVDKREKNKDGQVENKKLEVDFVANKADFRYYIQSVYSVQDGDKLEQELRPFASIPDSFKKILITRDDVNPYYNSDGILILNGELKSQVQRHPIISLMRC